MASRSYAVIIHRTAPLRANTLKWLNQKSTITSWSWRSLQTARTILAAFSSARIWFDPRPAGRGRSDSSGRITSSGAGPAPGLPSGRAVSGGGYCLSSSGVLMGRVDRSRKRASTVSSGIDSGES